MAGKQAKILTRAQLQHALRHVRLSRHPKRNRVMILLSIKAGLRAGEIAKLTWPMVLASTGRVADCIELRDIAAKKSSGRTIPLNPELRRALQALRMIASDDSAVIRSERNRPMRASSVVNWFAQLYRELRFDGCSSHSGRRTFITNAARVIGKVGGSLRDVQQLAGHSSIDQTQRYIEGLTAAKRRLVTLI